MDGIDSQGFVIRNRRWIWAAVALAAVGAYVWNATRPQTVMVAEVKNGAAERVLAITGRTRPQVTVTVLPRTSGQILELTKTEGQSVRAGELLVRLDADAQRAGVEQVDSNIASAQRAATEAQRNYERSAQLRERGLTTVREYDQARFDLDRAKQELSRLAATRREAAAKLSDTALYAPVSGVVLARPVDRGQAVNSQTVIYEIAPLADVEIEAEVDEQFLGTIREGMAADVLIPGKDKPLSASLYYIAPKVDPRTGGAKVRLRFSEKVVDLRSGLTADINLIVERRRDAITVARSAILGRDQRARVLVVSQGVVEARDVSFVDWPSERVIVERGLTSGDKLLLQPRGDLVGERVKGVTSVEELSPADRPRGSDARRAI